MNSGTTYTWLPKVGDDHQQDQPVYAVSNQPVPLLYGAIAAYRAFYVGMSDGADVGELTHDLIALGYGAGLTESNHYSSATAAAVERWQTALGSAGDRRRSCSARWCSSPARSGSRRSPPRSAQSGRAAVAGAAVAATVLTATSTTPIVTVDLDVTQEYLVKPGDAVIGACCPTAPRPWAARSRRSATWPPARAAAATAPATAAAARPTSRRARRAAQHQLHPDGDGHHHLGPHPARRHARTRRR